MKTRTEIRNWLLENAVDEDGDLQLSDLDFSEFDGNVYINAMKVKGDLNQHGHEVQGFLNQSKQTVGGNLDQTDQNVGHSLFQSYQKVGGDLNQSNHDVKGSYRSVNINVTGIITFEEPKKLLKEVTLEELAELGYKLKGEN